MKAMLFRTQDDRARLELAEISVSEPGPGEVLVRVAFCGANRLDLLVRSGYTPVKLALPHIPGSEVSGTVAALGPGVSGLEPDQRVVVHPYLSCGRCEQCLAGEETTCRTGDILGLMSQGGFAEYVVVPSRHVLPVPAGVTLARAAAVTLAALTAYHMLVTKARLTAGETVVVLAAGSGVGSAAVQLARLMGARVIATAGSDAKLERARALGAHATVNYTTEDQVAAVRRLTGRRGADVVFEHVGAATWDASMACLARNGRLVTCGSFTGNMAAVNLWTTFAKQLQIIGAYGGTRSELTRVLDLVAAGDFQPVIDRVIPLAEAEVALQALESRAQFGKILIEVAGE